MSHILRRYGSIYKGLPMFFRPEALILLLSLVFCCAAAADLIVWDSETAPEARPAGAAGSSTSLYEIFIYAGIALVGIEALLFAGLMRVRRGNAHGKAPRAQEHSDSTN